ncbi:MAG: GNAT family N-acetyltransferase [Gemmatimonadaceae bacterium]
MAQRPTIPTKRLILRPFVLTDAADVQRMARDKEIASTTVKIPHPYEDGMAEEWISTHQEAFESDEGLNLAITSRDTGLLVGSVGLRMQREHQRAELGFWVGKPFWGRGYCTEAAAAMVRHGFEAMGLNRIYAYYLSRNPASGRVLEKIGMTHEGRSRQHEIKWGQFEDLECSAIIASEYRGIRD